MWLQSLCEPGDGILVLCVYYHTVYLSFELDFNFYSLSFHFNFSLNCHLCRNLYLSLTAMSIAMSA